MNLRDRRIGQLLMAVALFLFFACEEESTLLGYKADSRFDVNFIEIPIGSSVYLADSIFTTNIGVGDRFLVGSYTDDLLGQVSSTAYTQYLRSGSIMDSLAFSTFDSVTLRLSLDFYNYGSGENTPQFISVYDLADTLINVAYVDSLYYFNHSQVPIFKKLGEKTFSVDPVLLNEYADDADNETEVEIKVPLDDAFGLSLFRSALAFEVDKDSTYYFYSRFLREFKGLAIIPESSDKILGINPLAANTMIVVHFHRDINNRRDSLMFKFSYLTSFNEITASRSGDVADIVNTYDEKFPPSGNRYVQNGVGLLTKLDFSQFLSFADTIPAMIINSAQVIIDDVQEESEFLKPHKGLGLRIVYNSLRVRSDTTRANFEAISEYKSTVSWGTISSAVPSGYVTAERSAQPLSMNLIEDEDSGKKYYSGFVTLFAQELFNNYKTGGPVFSKMALYPTSPQIGKSVERTYFGENAPRLRVYYTIPVNR